MSRKSAITMLGLAASLLIAAGLTFGWVWARSSAPPELVTPPMTSETPEQPAFVLVWIETVPPGATIRRLSDRAVLGRTPETIEFRRSDQPETIRLELPDYLSEERAVERLQDGRLLVRLKPKIGKRAP